MKAYKGFDENLKCRGFQYEVGGEYEEQNAEICSSGFHACESPLDTFRYYPPSQRSRYCAVDLDANDQHSDDSKRVGKRIKICAEIGVAGLAKAHIEYVKENTRELVENGNRGAATAGNCGAATAGNCGAATVGNRGAATAGDCGAATSRGSSATGQNGLSVARGFGVKVKGDLGAVLVAAEEENTTYKVKEWKAAVVDGVKIKPNFWYHIENGEFKEVEDENA